MSVAGPFTGDLKVVHDSEKVAEKVRSTILVSNLPDGSNAQMIRDIFADYDVQVLYVEIETDSALVHCYWTKELKSIVEGMTGLSLQVGMILKLELFENEEAAKRREVNRKDTRVPSPLLIVFGFDTSRVSESGISDIFSKVAIVQKVMIRSKFCFVRFKNIKSSTEAMEEYHGKEVLGSIISIEYGMTGVARSASDAAPSACKIVLDTKTDKRTSECGTSRKLRDRQFQCRMDKDLSYPIKNKNISNNRRRSDRSRSRDGRSDISRTNESRFFADRCEVDKNLPNFLTRESRVCDREAHQITSRGRRESNTVHQSKEISFQDTYEMANMNRYEDYYNDNQENSRTGYEVMQPDPPSECVDDSDIDYRTRRKRDRENRENNYESSY